MLHTKTATDYRFLARQSNFLKGFLISILFPQIEEVASFGKFSTEIFMTNFPQFSKQTEQELLELLKSKGFKVSINNGILKVDWS